MLKIKITDDEKVLVDEEAIAIVTTYTKKGETPINACYTHCSEMEMLFTLLFSSHLVGEMLEKVKNISKEKQLSAELNAVKESTLERDDEEKKEENNAEAEMKLAIKLLKKIFGD